jgi:hypothetical protein
LIAENWAHRIPFILIVDLGFQRLGDLHARPRGISILRSLCFSLAFEAWLGAATMEHDYENQVKHGLNNCIGIAVHIASVG